MDKRTLYDSFTKLELDTDATLHQITALKKGVEELVEENAVLQIENQHLRDRLDDIEKQKRIDEEVVEPEMTKSRMNLEKLYEDGKVKAIGVPGSRGTYPSLQQRAPTS